MNCGDRHPAYPFSPIDNFGAGNVPADFNRHENLYYFGSRFMFAFLLIAITFAVISVFMGLLALCSRLGGAISSFFASVLFLQMTRIDNRRLFFLISLLRH